MQDSHKDTLVEVIALLVKHENLLALQATLSQRQADQASEAPVRVIQQQRRLPPESVAELIRQYNDGSSVLTLAQAFRIHRTTVLQHLARHNVQCRRSVRSMTDAMVHEAAISYQEGGSLSAVASHFGVNAETLRREFKRANIPVRPRKGWPSD